MPVNSITVILILLFLLITFIMSAYDKLGAWGKTKDYYETSFKGILAPIAVDIGIIVILIAEVFVVTLLAFGIYDIISSNGNQYVEYALISSGILLIVLLTGLRLIQDNEGAARIGIYFLITISGFLI